MATSLLISPAVFSAAENEKPPSLPQRTWEHFLKDYAKEEPKTLTSIILNMDKDNQERTIGALSVVLQDRLENKRRDPERIQSILHAVRIDPIWAKTNSSSRFDTLLASYSAPPPVSSPPALNLLDSKASTVKVLANQAETEEDAEKKRGTISQSVFKTSDEIEAPSKLIETYVADAAPLYKQLNILTSKRLSHHKAQTPAREREILGGQSFNDLLIEIRDLDSQIRMLQSNPRITNAISDLLATFEELKNIKAQLNSHGDGKKQAQWVQDYLNLASLNQRRIEMILNSCCITNRDEHGTMTLNVLKELH